MAGTTNDPISEMPTVALVQRSPRVGLSAAIALFVVTIEAVAANAGSFGLVYLGWRDDGLTPQTTAWAAALAGVGLVTLRTMRILQRLMGGGKVLSWFDLAAIAMCGLLHAALAGALIWLTIVDPVDPRSNVIVIAVAASALATTVVLGLSGRAGRLPTDDEVSADAQALKARANEVRAGQVAAAANRASVPNRASGLSTDSTAAASA